jgi:hypothetical protein
MKRNIATYIAITVLALFGIGGLVGGGVAISMVNSSLTAQHITFGADTQYAGDKVTNGLQAYRFQKVIDTHVKAALAPVGLSTYEEVSAAARASATTANPAGDPKLSALRRTALDGQLLRGTLFSSFAWWIVGWVGIAAGVAFSTLAGCFFFLSRNRRETLYFPAPATTRETVSV